MNQLPRTLVISVLALALGAGACKGKKTPAAQPAAGSQAGSAGSQAGSATGPGTAPIPPTIRGVTPSEAVGVPERTAEDKALDAGRKPEELLNFLGVGRGMRVAELFAGGGYTTELLGRVVGPEGAVYGQNTKAILDMFAEKPWSERLARMKMPWVVRVDRELTEPLPPEADKLDLVVMNLVYHDTVAMGVDRAAMNGAIWKALKPGGMFAIIDHSAKAGSGDAAAKDLHRIDPEFVKKEIEAAGFLLDKTSNLYENAKDTRDWNAAPGASADKRGTSDRFAFLFRKMTGK